MSVTPLRKPQWHQKVVVTTAWCQDAGAAARIVDFFSANISGAYSTYAELPPKIFEYDPWHPQFSINVQAIESLIRASPTHPPPNTNAKFVVISEDSLGELAGFMIVSFHRSESPYVVLEDIVTRQSERGAGIGESMFEWCDKQAQGAGYDRWYLETSVQNTHAHRFFERLGFKPRAVIMERSRPK